MTKSDRLARTAAAMRAANCGNENKRVAARRAWQQRKRWAKRRGKKEASR